MSFQVCNEFYLLILTIEINYFLKYKVFELDFFFRIFEHEISFASKL